MRVAFDTGALLLLLDPRAKPPMLPGTTLPVSKCRERMEYLVEQLQAADDVIVIPSPALSEVLVLTDGREWLREIDRSRHLEIAPFDTRAAIEAAELVREGLAAGKGKRAGYKGTWQKVKVDMQIIAIARVHGIERLYSTDEDHVLPRARSFGMVGINVASLGLRPSTTPLLDVTEPEAPEGA